MNNPTKGRWLIVDKFRDLSVRSELSKDPIAIIKQVFMERTNDDGSSDNVGQSHNDMKANANLIAAAPDMYEALDNLLGYLETDNMRVLDMSLARKALAKARGE